MDHSIMATDVMSFVSFFHSLFIFKQQGKISYFLPFKFIFIPIASLPFSFFPSFFFFFSLGLHLRHVEVPRLGVESELWLPPYATAIPDLSHTCNLQQHRILNPLIGVKDGT